MKNLSEQLKLGSFIKAETNSDISAHQRVSYWVRIRLTKKQLASTSVKSRWWAVVRKEGTE